MATPRPGNSNKDYKDNLTSVRVEAVKFHHFLEDSILEKIQEGYKLINPSGPGDDLKDAAKEVADSFTNYTWLNPLLSSNFDKALLDAYINEINNTPDAQLELKPQLKAIKKLWCALNDEPDPTLWGNHATTPIPIIINPNVEKAMLDIIQHAIQEVDELTKEEGTIPFFENTPLHQKLTELKDKPLETKIATKDDVHVGVLDDLVKLKTANEIAMAELAYFHLEDEAVNRKKISDVEPMNESILDEKLSTTSNLSATIQSATELQCKTAQHARFILTQVQAAGNSPKDYQTVSYGIGAAVATVEILNPSAKDQFKGEIAAAITDACFVCFNDPSFPTATLSSEITAAAGEVAARTAEKVNEQFLIDLGLGLTSPVNPALLTRAQQIVAYSAFQSNIEIALSNALAPPGKGDTQEEKIAAASKITERKARQQALDDLKNELKNDLTLQPSATFPTFPTNPFAQDVEHWFTDPKNNAQPVVDPITPAMIADSKAKAKKYYDAQQDLLKKQASEDEIEIANRIQIATVLKKSGVNFFYTGSQASGSRIGISVNPISTGTPALQLGEVKVNYGTGSAKKDYTVNLSQTKSGERVVYFDLGDKAAAKVAIYTLIEAHKQKMKTLPKSISICDIPAGLKRKDLELIKDAAKEMGVALEFDNPENENKAKQKVSRRGMIQTIRGVFSDDHSQQTKEEKAQKVITEMATNKELLKQQEAKVRENHGPR